MTANGQRPNGKYDVGGILLPRPFKIRRLGHFGFNMVKLDEGREFYSDLLGFILSDKADFSRAPWFPKDAGLGDNHGWFMRYGSDHHAMVLFSKPVMDVRADRKFQPEVTINQITWQCGSLKEIVDAHGYFRDRQVPIQRVGRDMPGSNWHVYVYDPDGHTNELYYGIEQIGWNGRSKPREMYYRGFRDEPTLPQMSEAAEILEAQQKGIDIFSGHRQPSPQGETYEVEGVLLPRPFKITKIGPVSLFVDDIEKAESFYRERLGLTVSETAEYRGARCAFLRCGTEHHSVGLFPKELRGTLGLRADSSCMSFGVELGSYAQLRAAVQFLKQRGVTFVDIPPELYPGIDYSAFALDPDGHCIQLYYYIEQIGWDGRVRLLAERRHLNGARRLEDWPTALEPLSDSYADQVFQGPLG